MEKRVHKGQTDFYVLAFIGCIRVDFTIVVAFLIKLEKCKNIHNNVEKSGACYDRQKISMLQFRRQLAYIFLENFGKVRNIGETASA
jgi:hypothetical protein